MRFITALLTCLLVTTATPGVSTAATAGAAQAEQRVQRTRVSITASPEWVKKGGIVTLKGRVRGVRGRTTVTIFQKNKGSRKWVVEAKKRTTRKGRFTHREDVNSGDRTYRACVKRACDSVLVHMGKAPAQATALSITAVSSPTVEAGQAFTVSGAASSNLNGRAVEVQAYDGGTGSWGAVGRASVQNGSWSATASVSTAGRSVPLRAAFLGGVGLTASSTAASSLTVYGWYYLEDMDTVQGGWDLDGAQRISGVTYPKSVGENDETIQVDLQRSCIRLATVVGLDDTSSSTAKASLRLLADSVERYANTNLTLGVGYQVSIDLTGALRLVFQPAGVSGYPQIVMGDARVLCAF